MFSRLVQTGRAAPFMVCRRSLFIQTQSTPNPNSLKFIPGKPVLPAEGSSIQFDSVRSSQRSPLARELFRIAGVERVFFSSDFISVTVADDADWSIVKPDVFSAVSDFYSSGNPILSDDLAVVPNADTLVHEDDDEVVATVKELIETRIRPAVQEDGGDVVFKGITEKGIVQLEMQGSCRGCPSSAVTLKNGIENMLMHYVPEVSGVEEWKDELLQQVSAQQIEQLEHKLNHQS